MIATNANNGDNFAVLMDVDKNARNQSGGSWFLFKASVLMMIWLLVFDVSALRLMNAKDIVNNVVNCVVRMVAVRFARTQ